MAESNLQKLQRSSPSTRIVTVEDEEEAQKGNTSTGTTPATNNTVYVGHNKTEQQVAIYNAAFELYARSRPATKPVELPARPNASSPLETKTEYSKKLQAALNVSMQEAAVEAKALWEHLFNEKI